MSKAPPGRALPMLPEPLAYSDAGSPCVRNGCRLCCFDTQMPLLPDDTARLATATGHPPDAFSHVDEDGTRRLSNVDGHCFFLGATGCTVYADRPAGCRLYPLVWDPDARHAVLDPECPYTKGFRVRPRDRAALLELVHALGMP